MHRWLSGTPADPGYTADPGHSSQLREHRGAAFRPQSEAWPRGDVASSALAHRRLSRSPGTKVASLSGSLPLPFLPLRVGAHLPTPSARQLSGHPCGSLSSSSRFSAALGRGGGGRGPREASAADSTESGLEGLLNHLFSPLLTATVCFAFRRSFWKRCRVEARQDSVSALRTEVRGPRRLHLFSSSRGPEGPGSQSDAPSGSFTKLMWWHLDSHGLACLPLERRQY